MDHDSEMRKAKWVLIVGALFLVSCFMCYDELVYQISGQEAVATVAKVYTSTSRRGTNTTVEYTWAEQGGAQRKGMFVVDPSQPPSEGTKLPIRYTPGQDGRSRLIGRVPWVWIAIFAASLVGVGVFMFLMWREASEGDRPAKRKSRRV